MFLDAVMGDRIYEYEYTNIYVFSPKKIYTNARQNFIIITKEIKGKGNKL